MDIEQKIMGEYYPICLYMASGQSYLFNNAN